MKLYSESGHVMIGVSRRQHIVPGGFNQTRVRDSVYKLHNKRQIIAAANKLLDRLRSPQLHTRSVS